MMRTVFFLSFILYAYACEEHMTEQDCSDYNKMMQFNPNLKMTTDGSNTVYNITGQFYHENDYNPIFGECGDKFIRKYDADWLNPHFSAPITNAVGPL